MNSPQKILVCIDLSEYSEEVIEYAAMLRKSWQCDTILLNIINSREIDSLKAANNYLPESIDIDGYIERLTLERRQTAKDMIMKANAKELLDEPMIFSVGYPADEIIKMATEEKVDLIVLGRKGRTNLANMLFGSTAERVSKHALSPVLIAQSYKAS